MGITQSGLAAASAVSELVALVSVAERGAKLDSTVGVKFRGALSRCAEACRPYDQEQRLLFVGFYLDRLNVLAPDGVRTDARGVVVGLGRAAAV
jgi:hypothetical protein